MGTSQPTTKRRRFRRLSRGTSPRTGIAGLVKPDGIFFALSAWIYDEQSPPFSPNTQTRSFTYNLSGMLACPDTMSLDSPTFGHVVFTKVSPTLTFPILTEVEWQRQLTTQLN